MTPTIPQDFATTRIDDWRAAVAQHFVPLAITPPSCGLPFFVRATQGRFGDAVVGEFSVSACRAHRSRSLLSNAQASHLKVVWPLQGGLRMQTGAHDVEIGTKQWVIYETGREYVQELAEPGRFLVLMLPLLSCTGWHTGLRELYGRPLNVAGVPHIVLSALKSMLRNCSPLDGRSSAAMQDSVVALLECALHAQRVWTPPSAPRRGARLLAIQDFIRESASDRELTPDSVARSFGISRRSLYNLFLAAGDTPAAFIQSTRLVAASEQLRDPRNGDLSVIDIARDCAFPDHSHFSRAFRLRFGASPSQWRAQAFSAPPPAA